MASCSIAITSRPVLDAVAEMAGYPGWALWALRQPMEAVATVTLDAGDHSGPGWSIGWLQTISFNNWGLYKGATPADGSAWLNRGTPTSALVTLLDSEALGVPFAFYGDRPQALVHGGQLPLAVWLHGAPVKPIKLMVQDSPYFAWRYQIINSKTKAINLLTEARVEMQFCAAVALRDPLGRFTLLGGLSWTAIWANQLPVNARALIVPPGPGSVASVGPIFTGPPPNADVTRVLTGPRLTNYNAVINANKEGERQESGEWQTWPVRR